MQLQTLPMPGQPDIGRVPVHVRRGEHVRAVDRDTLRLVDRRRVAVIDRGVVLQVEADRSPFGTVEPSP